MSELVFFYTRANLMFLYPLCFLFLQHLFTSCPKKEDTSMLIKTIRFCCCV
jgi:hypothetical protein